MVLVSGKSPLHPGPRGRTGRVGAAALYHIPRRVIRQGIDYILGGGPLDHVVSGVVLVLEIIPAGIRQLRHVLAAVIRKPCGLLLGIHRRDQVVVCIITVSLAEFLPEQGQPVKEGHVGIMAVGIGDQDLIIILLCHIHIAQELPVQDIRAEVGVVGVIGAIGTLEDDLHAEAAGFVIVRLRQGCAQPPGVHHVGIPGLSRQVQGTGELFVPGWVTRHLEDMGIQVPNLLRYLCLSDADSVHVPGDV